MHDQLPPVPGRLHNNVNRKMSLGDELYVAISGTDEHNRVRVIAQGTDVGACTAAGVSMPLVNECILCDP
jgi:hypothetical protein